MSRPRTLWVIAAVAATLAIAGPPPAHATTVTATGGSGFVVVTDADNLRPLGSYFMPDKQSDTDLNSIEVVHYGAGDYRVRFNSPFSDLSEVGVVHIRAVGKLHCFTPNSPEFWNPLNGGTVVQVAVVCEDRQGAKKDSQFVATYAHGGVEEGVLISANLTNATCTGSCLDAHNVTSSIGGAVTTAVIGPGTYRVDLPRPTPAQATGVESVVVSSQTPAVTCAVTSTLVLGGGTTTGVEVRCRNFWNATPSPIVRFALSYSRGGNILGEANRTSDAHAQVPLVLSSGVPVIAPSRNRHYGNSDLAVIVSRSGTGLYEVQLEEQAVGSSPFAPAATLITPVGENIAGGQCEATHQWNSFNDAMIDVVCTDYHNNPVDSAFNLQYFIAQ